MVRLCGSRLITRMVSLPSYGECVVCQQRIAQHIIAQEGHYMLALKGNHGVFAEEAEEYANYLKHSNFKGVKHDYYEDTDSDHGRIETRRTWSVPCDWYDDKGHWSGLNTRVIVESERIIGEEQTHERRRYISDVEYSQAKEFHEGVRSHWGVENNLHWQLDVTFGEDQSRIRKDHGPSNMSLIQAYSSQLTQTRKNVQSGHEKQTPSSRLG